MVGLMTNKNFLQNDDAVNIVTGQILNLVILLLITGGIVGVFYLKAEDSSHRDMRIGFTDLGSQISRDITNSQITVERSPNPPNISINIVRNIPITIGGKGYKIVLNATSRNMATVNITDGDFSGNEVDTVINSVDIDNIGGIVYSSSGKISIGLIKNNSGEWIWIY